MKNITRRYCSFIFGGLVAAALIGYGIYALVSTADAATGGGCIAAGVLGFCLVSCLFLGNNFIGDVVESIFCWGFVRMPGLIFELDLDGIIWFLTVKLLFWILGFVLAFLCGILAIAIGAVLSVFVYPYAIIKNLRSDPEAVEE